MQKEKLSDFRQNLHANDMESVLFALVALFKLDEIVLGGSGVTTEDLNSRKWKLTWNENEMDMTITVIDGGLDRTADDKPQPFISVFGGEELNPDSGLKIFLTQTDGRTIATDKINSYIVEGVIKAYNWHYPKKPIQTPLGLEY